MVLIKANELLDMDCLDSWLVILEDLVLCDVCEVKAILQSLIEGFKLYRHVINFLNETIIFDLFDLRESLSHLGVHFFESLIIICDAFSCMILLYLDVQR